MKPQPLVRADFEIRPRDGTPVVRGELRALRGAAPRSAVVLCHGFKGFRRWGFFPALARALALRGHAAISFDFSHNGVGADGVDFSALDLFARNTHTRNVREIGMVLDAVSSAGLFPAPPRRVGLFGHSRGGGEAVLVAAADARVDALVTWAAIGSVERWSPAQIAAWERDETVEIANSRTGQMMPLAPSFHRDIVDNRARLDIRAAASRVAVPWLIVHGDADASVSVDDGHALFEAAGPGSELLIVEGADHTFGATHPLGAPSPALRTVLHATLDWFDAHLADPEPGPATAD